MFNLGAGEVVVILLVALIVLGPNRLPEAARTVGRVMGELRRLSTGFQAEVREAFQDDTSPSPLDRRRTESKPLAATVEEADRGVAGATSGRTVAPDSPRRRAPAAGSANGDGTTTGSGNGVAAAGSAAGNAVTGDAGDDALGTAAEPAEVAPEVGEALDQISAAFPSAAPSSPAAPSAPAPADAGPDDDPQAP
jgi:sec-independent protein translocase protein TatB